MFGGEEDNQGSHQTEQHKASYRAVLEKKLSIVDRAVTTNPSCIALQLERLKICQELWEPSALAKEWKKLVRPLYLLILYKAKKLADYTHIVYPMLQANSIM